MAAAPVFGATDLSRLLPDTSGTSLASSGTMWGVGRPADKRISFNEVPEIYDEIRPSYPAELFDLLFEMLPSEPDILEVGPGTGQATKDLLARGASVQAVEIGSATAAKLRSNLASDRLRVIVSGFEELELRVRASSRRAILEPAVADRAPQLGAGGDVAAGADGAAVGAGDGSCPDRRGGSSGPHRSIENRSAAWSAPDR